MHAHNCKIIPANVNSIQVCDGVLVNKTVINIHSIGLPDAEDSCFCDVNSRRQMNQVYYSYDINNDRVQNCGIKLVVDSKEFFCKKQNTALTSLKAIRFYKTLNATAEMCLEIRTGTIIM